MQHAGTDASVSEAITRYQQECELRCSRILLGHAAAEGPAGAPQDSSERAAVPDAAAWLRLPVALAAAWQNEQRHSVADQVLEVLWGQYALFMAIRLQDDLFDGHSGDLRLQFLADRFIVESLDALQSLPQLDASFWTHYRDWFNATTEAIVEVARLQGQPGRFLAEQLHLHTRVNAIFHIGVAGVCWLFGRRAELNWIAHFQDELAIFEQITDDLHDLQEDVAAGKFTFPVNSLSGTGVGEHVDNAGIADLLHRGFLEPARAEPIWSQLTSRADRAAELIPPYAPEEFRVVAARLRQTIDSLQDAMHSSRVRLLFGPELIARQP